MNRNRPHVRRRWTARLALLAGAAALAWGVPATALAGVGADSNSTIPVAAGVAAPLEVPLGAPLEAPADAPAAALPPLLPGEVVTLLGSRPELWVSDADGALHFASDTRALAGRAVDWSFRLQVSVEQLRGLPQGDPWLSTAMVASGETIFQPRWDTLAAAPTLYRLQTAGDLPLYGISAENYSTYVLPAAEWEQRYGFRIADLPQRPAPPLVDAPPPVSPPAPPPATPTAPPAAAATATPPAAPTSTPAGGGLTPVPTSAPGTLTRTPVYAPGGDVYFTLPPGRDWRDASNAIAPLRQLSPTGMLQGERILGIWSRTLNDAPYVYIQFDAVDLNFHTEVKTVADLAALKMGFLRRDSETAQVGSLRGMTAGGQPAQVADSVWGRRFPGGPGGRGQPSASEVNQFVTQHNSNDPVSELLWTERDVFVLRGNWGYVLRLYSTGPGVKSANEADLDRVLATLTFNY